MLCENKNWKRQAPGSYWSAEPLYRVPAFRDSPFPDSHAPGLRDILFDGMPVNGKPAPVFAYIGMPEGPAPEGGFPGIVLIHGGGGTAFPGYVKLWVSYGYAVIALDWYNQRPLLAPDSQGDEMSVTERAPLEGGKRQDHVANVGNMVLAHSLLRSLPGVDPEKTGFVGLSWGSWYGAIVASVDTRFRFALEIYCGGVNRKLDPGMAFFEFVDGRFLHAAKVPVCWISGTNDHNIVPEQIQDAWEECPKAFNKSFIIELPHSHIGFTFPSCRRTADAFLKGGTHLPRLKNTKLENGIISARIDFPGKGNLKPVLCFLPDGPMPEKTWDRVWYKLPAKIEGDRIFASVPENALQCFLSAYDEESKFDDCCGSSDLVILPRA